MKNMIRMMVAVVVFATVGLFSNNAEASADIIIPKQKEAILFSQSYQLSMVESDISMFSKVNDGECDPATIIIVEVEIIDDEMCFAVLMLDLDEDCNISGFFMEDCI